MRLLHIDAQQAAATPITLVLRHLEYHSIEQQIREMKQNESRQQ